jgi:hypothetical protein
MPSGVYNKSEEHKIKLSNALKGKPRSSDSCNKQRESVTGNKNHFYGKKHSEETKRKISESKKGKSPAPNKGKPCSDITKRKIGDANKGRIHTEEERNKRSAALKGKRRTKEQRIKMSCIQRGIPIEAFNGFSWQKYCNKFDRPLKERVRSYFGRMCVHCGKLEKDNGRKLDVHHVNFDKMICCNDVKPLFVALCRSCHSKTNHLRDGWEEYFTNMINDKYNGKCYYTKEEYGRLSDLSSPKAKGDIL